MQQDVEKQQDATGCRESIWMQRKQQAVTLIQQDTSGTDGYSMMHNAARYKKYSNTVKYRRMQRDSTGY
jgi:hypothetical protein